MDGAKTVGDLMARIRAVTGVEIYADRRYAELDVYSRSGVNVLIRAGDLLKTLALSVTGTCRRVASGADAAFVLTDDRVGSGIRLTLIGIGSKTLRHVCVRSNRSCPTVLGRRT